MLDVTIGDCITAFALDMTDNDNAFADAAWSKWNRDGEIEIDDRAIVSGGYGGSGAYVMAWVWVANEEAEAVLEKQKP